MVLKLGILASGRGTGFQAILDHINMKILVNVEIELVVYNNKDAEVSDRAEQAGIKTLFLHGIVGKKFDSKEQRELARIEFDKQIVDACENEGVELIVCAGFNQILSEYLVEHYTNRILNIHPAVDVVNYGGYGMVGMKVHDAVINAKEEFSGCTVHYIDSTVDLGPILLQAKVPVYEGDTAESLSERILVMEHRTYPKAVQLHVDNRVKIENGKAIVDLVSGGWGKKWNDKQIKYFLYQRDEWRKKNKELSRILNPNA